MLLKRYLEDNFKRVQDIVDKVDEALVPVLLGKGTIFYVDNTNGSNSRTGKSWDTAFSTLNYAISQCTDDAGDVILLAPWHTETIADTGTASGTTTDELVADKSGISIIGLGHGTLVPTFSLATATDAAMVVLAGATNVRIKNLKFVSALADVAAAITLSATSDGAVIEDCIFTDGGTDVLELVIGISVAADCDNITIRNCRFRTVAGGACGAAIRLAGGSDNSLIEDNYAYGTYATSAFDADVAASLNLELKGNTFLNEGAAAVELHADTTGALIHNNIGGTTSVAAALTGETKMFCAGNLVAGNVAEGAESNPAGE